MSAIQTLKSKLVKYPELTYSETPSSLEVPPVDDTGFSVSLIDEAPNFTVHYEGWHEHFTDQEQALNCFAFGLSASCRLVVTRRGTTPVHWQLEVFQEGSWIPDSCTGLIFTPFWRAKNVVHLQNHVIE